MHIEGVGTTESILQIIGREAVEQVVAQVAEERGLDSESRAYSLVLSGADLGLRAQLASVQQTEVALSVLLGGILRTLDEEALQRAHPEVTALVDKVRPGIAAFLARRREAIKQIYANRVQEQTGLPQGMVLEYLNGGTEQSSDILFRAGVKLFECSARAVAGWHIRATSGRLGGASGCNCHVCLANECEEDNLTKVLMDMITEHGSLEGALTAYAEFRLVDSAHRVEELVNGVTPDSSMSHAQSSGIVGDLWQRISKP